MADAGKIMIMPKGAYDASASYEVLDLVTHKGNVWVAKRNVTGVEPNSANSADWFLMADLANYLPKSGGEINGTTDLKSYDATNIAMNVANSLRSIGMRVYSNGVADFFDYTNNKNIFRSMADGTNTFNGTATGNLPLSGGTVTKNGTKVMGIHNTNSDYTLFEFYGNGSELGSLGFDGVNNPMYRGADGKTGTLLHTGNKPTGSYTGNGSATARTISTGGLGNCCLIYRIDGAVMAIVSPNGATTTITLDGYTGSSHSFISNSKMAFSNGVLTIATDNANVNMSGAIFYYQVL